MKLLNNMKVGTKITLLVAALLLCIATAAGVGIYQLRQLDAQSDILYDNDMLALGAVKEATIQIGAMSRVVMNMALASGDRTGYRSAYEAGVESAARELRKVQNRLLTAESKDLFDRANKAFALLLPEQQKVMDKVEAVTPEETFAALAVARSYAIVADNLMTQLGDSIAKAGEERSRAM